MIVVEENNPQRNLEKMSGFLTMRIQKWVFFRPPPQKKKKKNEIQRHVAGLFFLATIHFQQGNSPLHGGLESRNLPPKNAHKISGLGVHL